jgi:hypothetical protein
MNTMGSPPEDTMRRVRPDHAVFVAADADALAQLEAGGEVGHRLVMAARDLPAGDQIAGLAGLAGAAGVTPTTIARTSLFVVPASPRAPAWSGR